VAETDIYEHNPKGTAKLLCDYDHRKAPSIYRYFAYRAEAIAYSRSSNGGWHVIVYLKQSIPWWESIANQFMLGSDPNRERYNFQRLMAGDPANILFKRKIK
jgi:hypothetical protein